MLDFVGGGCSPKAYMTTRDSQAAILKAALSSTWHARMIEGLLMVCCYGYGLRAFRKPLLDLTLIVHGTVWGNRMKQSAKFHELVKPQHVCQTPELTSHTCSKHALTEINLSKGLRFKQTPWTSYSLGLPWPFASLTPSGQLSELPQTSCGQLLMKPSMEPQS